MLFRSQAALDCEVKKVIALSTDKAAAPINLYGATKLCSDKLFIAANNIKGDRDILFSVVRYGNVMGSRGSVIPLLIDQIKNNRPFTITDPNMTRFMMSMDEALDLVGLVGKEMHYPNELSGGEQQRASLARAIIKEPDLILADEPTANLDSKTGVALLETMRELNENEGVTFLFSTHDQKIIERARRLVWLEDGMVTKDEAPERL